MSEFRPVVVELGRVAARSVGRARARRRGAGAYAAFSASGLISVLRKTAKPMTAAYEK